MLSKVATNNIRSINGSRHNLKKWKFIKMGTPQRHPDSVVLEAICNEFVMEALCGWIKTMSGEKIIRGKYVNDRI